MSGIATAMVATAVIGGAAQSRAAKKGQQAAQAGTDAQLQASREANELTERMAEQARTDVNRLFGQQEANTRAGIQAGLDLYGQTIPAQFEQSRAGNLAAQQMLSGALPQMNQAILGGAIDYSQFQPSQTPQVDTSMFNVQMPEYTPIAGQPQPEQQQPQPQSFLGGNQFYPAQSGLNAFNRGGNMFAGVNPTWRQR